MMSKDYYSIQLQYAVYKAVRVNKEGKANHGYILFILYRLFVVIFCEANLVLIIYTANMAQTLGLGLILNFSAGIIIC